MEKEKLLKKLSDLIKSFKSQELIVQKENLHTLCFIKDQHKAIKMHGVVDRHSVWHPQTLFEFKDEHKFNCIRDYFTYMGDGYENIMDLKRITVFDYRINKSIEL